MKLYTEIIPKKKSFQTLLNSTNRFRVFDMTTGRLFQIFGPYATVLTEGTCKSNLLDKRSKRAGWYLRRSEGK